MNGFWEEAAIAFAFWMIGTLWHQQKKEEKQELIDEIVKQVKEI